jgi:WD40 repeat protein
MDYHYDGTVLASCSYDGLLRLWDTHNGHCLTTRAFQLAEQPLSSVVFSPNGRHSGWWRGFDCWGDTLLGFDVAWATHATFTRNLWDAAAFVEAAA